MYSISVVSNRQPTNIPAAFTTLAACKRSFWYLRVPMDLISIAFKRPRSLDFDHNAGKSVLNMKTATPPDLNHHHSSLDSFLHPEFPSANSCHH